MQLSAVYASCTPQCTLIIEKIPTGESRALRLVYKYLPALSHPGCGSNGIARWVEVQWGKELLNLKWCDASCDLKKNLIVAGRRPSSRGNAKQF